jgi:hypothetical protein
MDTPLIRRTTSTFIPKRQALVTPRTSLFFGLSMGILFLAICAWGGLIFYTKTLTEKNNEIKGNLSAILKEIENETLLNDLRILDTRLKGVEVLLNNHTTIKPLFSFIENITLTSSVRFADFDFSNFELKREIEMSGTARDFESVAYQSKLFLEDPLIKSVDFKTFSVDEKTGDVKFTVVFMVDPALLSYKTAIEE